MDQTKGALLRAQTAGGSRKPPKVLGSVMVRAPHSAASPFPTHESGATLSIPHSPPSLVCRLSARVRPAHPRTPSLHPLAPPNRNSGPARSPFTSRPARDPLPNGQLPNGLHLPLPHEHESHARARRVRRLAIRLGRLSSSHSPGVRIPPLAGPTTHRSAR